MSRWRIFESTLIFAAACATLAGTVVGGPPLIIDDPETPGVHGWEVNVSNIVERTPDLLSVDGPHLDINYGALENDQWKIELPAVRFADSEVANAAPHAGVGDVLCGYKYRFLDEAKCGISVSAYPQLLLPTGNRNLQVGEGNTEFLAEFQFGKHYFKEKLFLYAQVGYTACFNDSSFDSWDYGIAADWKATKKLELMCDIGGHVFPNAGAMDYTFYEVGVAYHFNETVAFIGSVGSSFPLGNTNTPDFTSYMGLQFTWGAEKSDKDKSDEEKSDKKEWAADKTATP